MTCYIIRVKRNGEAEYLFNTRVLLKDPALAKAFSSLSLARRYFKKTKFSCYSFDVLPAERMSAPDDVDAAAGE